MDWLARPASVPLRRGEDLAFWISYVNTSARPISAWAPPRHPVKVSISMAVYHIPFTTATGSLAHVWLPRLRGTIYVLPITSTKMPFGSDIIFDRLSIIGTVNSITAVDQGISASPYHNIVVSTPSSILTTIL